MFPGVLLLFFADLETNRARLRSIEEELSSVSSTRRQVRDRVDEVESQVGVLDNQLETGISLLRKRVREGILIGLRQATQRALQTPALGQPWTGNGGERYLLIPTDMPMDGLVVPRGKMGRSILREK